MHALGTHMCVCICMCKTTTHMHVHVVSTIYKAMSYRAHVLTTTWPVSSWVPSPTIIKAVYVEEGLMPHNWNF